jgi:hypothetical protein
MDTNWRSITNFARLLFYTLGEERSVPTDRRAFPNVAVKIEDPCLCRISNPCRLAGCMYIYIHIYIYTYIYIYEVKLKGNFTPEQATKFQRGSTGIALLFL